MRTVQLISTQSSPGTGSCANNRSTATLLPFLVCFAVCCGMPASVDSVEHDQPGLFENIPCIGDAEFTYTIIIPTGYDNDDETHYPGLFISSAGGTPGIKGYREWANDRGIIVVAINNSQNGPWDNNKKAQDLVLDSLDQRAVRLHHCLNFAAGASGAGASSVKLVNRFPERFAGVHISVHSGNGSYAKPHQAVTMYAGVNDHIHPFSAVVSARDTYLQNGNLVRFETHNNKHKGASAEHIAKDVEWMLHRTMFSHPALKPADKDFADHVLSGLISDLQAQQPDPRLEGLEDLLAVPAIIKSTHGDTLVTAWTSTIDEAANSAADDLSRFWVYMKASQHPAFSAIDRSTRKQIGSTIKTLRKDPMIAKEYAAFMAYHKLAEMKNKARSSREHDRVRAGVDQLVAEFGDTEYGEKALSLK